MTSADLSQIYRNYIACLNGQDWPGLGRFVDDEVRYNGRQIGLSGYREMLERDFREIPDLYFDIQLLISDPPRIASRLRFDCTPKGKFLGLDVNGRKISFTENVFYEFRESRICEVWSIIDKAAIEGRLEPPSRTSRRDSCRELANAHFISPLRRLLFYGAPLDPVRKVESFVASAALNEQYFAYVKSRELPGRGNFPIAMRVVQASERKPGEKAMFRTAIVTLALGFGLVTSAHAGCATGAAAGGVLGHMAGHHAVVGAAIGCAVGHHHATKAKQLDQQNQGNQNPSH